ncbi:hypothetical protein EYF80_042816 [Liparis tanakae]|uniref:Uncharacterized protein n=1 Tax=Liparis tanakae TaxID=230148 RepID=A0A4Z2G144_9TELE|nr:hypothetical protein EYF80_042816 [Liparis tanakae]
MAGKLKRRHREEQKERRSWTSQEWKGLQSKRKRTTKRKTLLTGLCWKIREVLVDTEFLSHRQRCIVVPYYHHLKAATLSLLPVNQLERRHAIVSIVRVRSDSTYPSPTKVFYQLCQRVSLELERRHAIVSIVRVRSDSTYPSPTKVFYQLCQRVSLELPAVECILPELSKDWRGSHFRGRDIQDKVS